MPGAGEAPPDGQPGPAIVCGYTYDQWHMPGAWGGGNFTNPWWRPAGAADAQSARTGKVENFVHINHIRPYIVMSTDQPCPEHVIRWLQEGLAYGDAIVPLSIGIRDRGGGDGAATDGPLPEPRRPDTNSALLFESKEHMRARGLRSPDTWDAVALTFAEPVGDDRPGLDALAALRSRGGGSSLAR